MKKHPDRSDTCPLAAVDQRLADAHRLWHQAEAEYFDPDGFRLAIQNTIQTLRTVTFILQKNKAIIPNFAEWYGEGEKRPLGGWQRRLADDPLMRWMVEARNKIEKQGDLESDSMVRAEVLASYIDEGPRLDVPADLFEPIAKLLERIPDSALGAHIKRNGVLRIQRRWVENTLPSHELLDAVAVAYGKIAELVHDAHRQIGLDPPTTIHDDDGTSYDLASMGWRLPCMMSSETTRTLLVSLSDGSEIEFETRRRPVKVNSKSFSNLVKRYGEDAFKAIRRNYESDADLAAGFFALARRVFLRDRHHLTILLLFRDRELIRQPIQINVENTAQKYVVMRQLAVEAQKSGADAAMLIGEVWMAEAHDLKPYERPKDTTKRREALTLQFINNSGTVIDCLAEIARSGKAVSLDETQLSDQSAPFDFAPFLQVWGLPVPEAWVQMSQEIMLAHKPE